MIRQARLGRERGAIIIQVAFALLALLAFTTFVIDGGVMWTARRQAQNAADSAALGGAISLIRDGGSQVVARGAAIHYAAVNPIWGEGNSAANVRVTFSGTPDGGGAAINIPPCGTNRGCVRVDVYRNMPEVDPVTGNTLPPLGSPIAMFMGDLVGIFDQGVRATATAEVQAGNMIRCMLPFAVADRWSDGTDGQVNTFANDGFHLPPNNNPIAGWSPNDFYEEAPASPGGTDFYTPPYHPGHTGWTVAGDANRPTGDYGRQLVLKKGGTGDFSAGWSNLVDLVDSIGSCPLLQNIRDCNETPVAIAKETESCADFSTNNTTTPEMAARGCIGIKSGVTTGPTTHGVEDSGGCPTQNPNLFDQDPGARWTWEDKGIGPRHPISGAQMPGAVVDAAGNPNMNSPRIRPIAVFDIDHYMAAGCQNNMGGTGCVTKVANIIGFFVEGICATVRDRGELDPGVQCSSAPGNEDAKEVVGRIVTLPSTYAVTGGDITEDAAFLRLVRLVR